MKLHILATLLALISAPAAGKDLLDGPFRAQVISVYDGDTFRVRVRIWLETDVTTNVRILGIDAPEMKGRCAEESRRAIEARDRLAQLLAAGPVDLWNVTGDKYAGRVDANVIAAGVDVARRLIELGLARPYDGRARQGWCG